MNKPVYLGPSILKINKIVMYEIWHDYVQQKHEEKAKLCYMDPGNFTIFMKTWIILKNNVRVYCIKTESMYLFNR